MLRATQFKAKIKTVIVYNFYVQNTIILKNISILDISEFGTFRVGLLLRPARSLFGPSEPRKGLVAPWAKPGSGLEIMTWPVHGRRSQ